MAVREPRSILCWWLRMQFWIRSLNGAASFSELCWVVLGINTVLEPRPRIPAFRLKYHGDQCHPMREKGGEGAETHAQGDPERVAVWLQDTEVGARGSCRWLCRELVLLLLPSEMGSDGNYHPWRGTCCRTVELRCSAQVLHLSVGPKSPHLLHHRCVTPSP